MGILFLLFLVAMVVLAFLHAIAQFRDHPVAMTICCLVAFLLMYVIL